MKNRFRRADAVRRVNAFSATHFLCTIICALVGLPGCGRQGADPQQVLSANRELDRKFAEAVVGLDLDGIMQCWWNSPDVRRYPADNLDGLAGWASIKAAWGHQITGMQRVLRFEISGQTYFIRGDAVIGTGRIDLRIVPKGSPGEVEMSMRFTDLREQKEGRWVYVYSHESLSPMSVLNDPGLLTYE